MHFQKSEVKWEILSIVHSDTICIILAGYGKHVFGLLCDILPLDYSFNRDSTKSGEMLSVVLGNQPLVVISLLWFCKNPLCNFLLTFSLCLRHMLAILYVSFTFMYLSMWQVTRGISKISILGGLSTQWVYDFIYIYRIQFMYSVTSKTTNSFNLSNISWVNI